MSVYVDLIFNHDHLSDAHFLFQTCQPCCGWSILSSLPRRSCLSSLSMKMRSRLHRPLIADISMRHPKWVPTPKLFN